MSAERVERRLAAILAADVAGYSRLMGEDEAGTLGRLRTHRHELIDPQVAEHKGRIVKTTGDGILIEFPSVVEAVACAVAVQHGMAERNTGIPPAQRIVFRVGINLGDVIVEDGDIHGDGVNVAARLEGLAEPGEICVSAVVHDQVRGRLDCAFDDLGEQALKNIARPLRIYRVRPTSPLPTAPPHAGEGRSPQSGDRVGAAGAPALALPDKPSIAVLPFQNMSGDPEQEYFADGMVEEITTAIARLPWLFVIARNSSFAYKGKSPDLRQVGRELGVRYVLEGSVRKAANRVRITGQLIDTTTGAHIWADRFDGALDDIFELQDQVASSVVGAIEPRLRLAEIERASRKSTNSLDAYDLYLRALAEFHKWSADSLRKAVELLRAALSIDPSYAPAAALLAFCRGWQRSNGWEAISDEMATETVAIARHAFEAGRNDPEVLWMVGQIIAYFALGSGDNATGQDLIERALTLNPNSALAWCARGYVLNWVTQPEPAIESFTRAMRLSPLDPLGYMFKTGIAQAYILAGQLEEAMKWIDQVLREQPRNPLAVRLKTVLYGHLGMIEEAREWVQNLTALNPGASVRSISRILTNSWVIAAIQLEGLRKAGLPEE